MNLSDTQLTDEVRDQGLEAMTVLAMSKHRSTADFASMMLVHSADGTSSSGFEPARMLLLDALASYPKAWAAFLSDPDHGSAARSMQVALSDDIRSALAEFPGTEVLLKVIDEQARKVADAQVLSQRLAGRHFEETVIDLTESKIAI